MANELLKMAVIILNYHNCNDNFALPINSKKEKIVRKKKKERERKKTIL